MSAESLPSLDIAPLVNGGAGAVGPAFLDALDTACRDWGFFLVTGHGVPSTRLADFDRAARAFFALPDAAKQAVSRSADNPWGYYDRELTKNARDWKEIFDFGPERSVGGARNRWPAGQPRFRAAARAHYADCTRVAEALLDAISVALGTTPTALREAFVGHSSFLRINHYPACDDPADADAAEPTRGHLGVNRHTDAGALTILYQDEVPALQVRHRERWVVVPSLPGSLVVNLGDMLQVWSNDRYIAPLHRVLARHDTDRVSAPFFYNPSFTTWVAPLANVLRDAGAPLYPPVSWQQFRNARSAGDYADLGQEVQISDYRLRSGRSA